MGADYRANRGDIKCVRSARRRAHISRRELDRRLDLLAAISPARHLAALARSAFARPAPSHSEENKSERRGDGLRRV